MNAILYAVNKNNKLLEHCGYHLKPIIHYFDGDDDISLIDTYLSLIKQKVWAILGPRRSKALLVGGKVIPNIPIISPMANDPKIYNSQSLIFTSYPPVSQFAKKMFTTLTHNASPFSYAVFVDARCPACVAFANDFIKLAAPNKPAFYLQVAEDSPNLDHLIKSLKRHPIDYLILPNYSQLSGYVMGNLSTTFPKLDYIGSDGWGENSFSYIQGYDIKLKPHQALSIRNGKDDSDKLKDPLVKALMLHDSSTSLPPVSIINMVRNIEILATDLCHSKAKTATEFAIYEKHNPKDHFLINQPYAIYSIFDGHLQFYRYAK
ncbi:MAG: hypothetical protein ACO2ZM_00410 [Francisellaceae bacterium]